MYACLYCPGNGALLMECAAEFSPHVEQTAADTVIFDVRGLESLYGPPEQLARAIERRAGVPANIAIASNPDAALHAARGIRGVTVIPPGKEAETLAPLPVNLLGGSAGCAELLDLWGIRTFGEFAKLPPLGVAARLGDEGVRLHRLARGEGYRRLRPAEAALRFEAEMELDHPIDLLEPLSFVISRLLNEVCDQLRGRSLATNELRLCLLLENAPDTTTLARLYGQIGRMRLVSSAAVVKEANNLAHKILDAYAADNRSKTEVRDFLARDSIDLFSDFGDACRAELLRLEPHGMVLEGPLGWKLTPIADAPAAQ